MFELALPWVFILLPLPLLIWWMSPSVTFQLPVALKVPFFNAMASLLEEKRHVHRKPSVLIVLMTIWTLLLLALAGPRWIGAPIPQKREGYHMMLALDLSGSMELNDMVLHHQPVSRLAVVKRAAAQFVKERKTDKIGLILFGTQAYLQTPLTYDHHTLLMRIQDASVGLAGKTTSIGDALGLAVKRLQNVPRKGRVIILLTDGVNNSGVLAPIKAAELAAAEGIKIYTIGLGSDSESQAINPMLMALNAPMDLDEDTLKAVAKITGGEYFRATDSPSLQSIYHTINQMERVTQEQQMTRPRHEYYAWPLAIAFLLFFALIVTGQYRYPVTIAG